MTRKGLLFVLVTAVAVAGLLVAGCAPEAAPPEEEEAPPKEEEAPPEEEKPPAEPEEAQFKWRLQTPFPTGFVTYWEADTIGQWITEMSNGRITVDVLPSGAVVPGLKEMRAVHEGVLDAAWTGSHYHTSEIGLGGDLFNLYPAGLAPREMMTWVYEYGGDEQWQEMYDRMDLNVKAMFAGLTSAELFGWFKEPVDSMEDFKGMKFRTAGIWGEMLTEAGAAVVTMPGGEVYESAQRGVIDAFEFSSPGVDYSAGFHELGAYMHGPGIHAPQAAFELLINKDSWNELSPDLQSIVMRAAEAMVARGWAHVDAYDTEGIQSLKEYGTEFVTLPVEVQEEIVELANEKYDEIAQEDEFFARVLESQRDFVAKYREFKAFTQPDPQIMTYQG
ncbi:MAG: TRAP transporter substrate-binding protein [Chloroflexota bacterium]